MRKRSKVDQQKIDLNNSQNDILVYGYATNVSRFLDLVTEREADETFQSLLHPYTRSKIQYNQLSCNPEFLTPPISCMTVKIFNEKKVSSNKNIQTKKNSQVLE